ncbi:MAG TPA: methylated-DNA--[protein]-cysteine S-methyltransferase [Vicinamibacterales bacterium]|nr:methylated-DNA--[protein]-cysteine S-methyltransferase [Vicinamibacterales bacterium]
MVYRTIHTPVGALLLAADAAALRVLAFAGDGRAPKAAADWRPDTGELNALVDELKAYFAGALQSFTTPVAPQGTPFQRAVWEQLRKIPYGETISYGELARRLGNPKAVRAVGLANGSNPISILIPCHRVIGSNGSLVGYGGGLPIKQALLALERGQTRLL